SLGLWHSWLPKSNPPEKVPAFLTGFIGEGAELQWLLYYWTAAAAAAAVLVFLAIAVFERRFLHVEPGRQLTETRGRPFFRVVFWIVFPLLGVVSMAAFALFPIELPRRLGVIPIFALWAAVVTGLASAGTRFHDATRIPAVTIAVIAVVAFAILDLSENHKLRFVEGAQKAVRSEPDAAFLQWIRSRADLNAYKERKKPYPVYIVAAEGGGLYAAYHTAKVLSRLQDMCENFAQHTFAVSSVSGGSIGAAVFAALAQGGLARNGEAKPCTDRYIRKENGFEAKAERILSQDFLSPLVWAGLFPDFLQRFLPVPIYSLDRAQALEKSMEHYWRRAQGSPNPFERSFFALCSPGSGTCAPKDVAAPALLLNMTNVETGMQMVLSPLYLRYIFASKVAAIEDFYRDDPAMQQMPLSTAVGLSARFPWVLPAGWHEFTVQRAGGASLRRMSFADGGYYEGSGVATARNLARYLRWYLKDSADKPDLDGLEVAIHIIMITGSPDTVERFFGTEQDNKSLGEIATPLATFLQSWRARSAALPLEIAIDAAAGGYVVKKSAQFDNYYLPLPLGLQLGNLSIKYLDLFSGFPENCGKADDPTLDPAIRAVFWSMDGHDCLVKEVAADLQPDRSEALRKY
ncbi:MAG: hypothetical protein ACREC6_14500, partial [Hyphomicrobiaceae bacterium]